MSVVQVSTNFEQPQNHAEAAQAVKELVSSAENLISLATRVADEWYVEFDFSMAYGMGGKYNPVHRDGVSRWALPSGDGNKVSVDDLDFYYFTDAWSNNDGRGWVSSSSQC